MFFSVENLKDGIWKQGILWDHKRMNDNTAHIFLRFIIVHKHLKMYFLWGIDYFCLIKGYFFFFFFYKPVLEDVDLLGFLGVICLFAAFLPNALTFKGLYMWLIVLLFVLGNNDAIMSTTAVYALYGALSFIVNFYTFTKTTGFISVSFSLPSPA